MFRFGANAHSNCPFQFGPMFFALASFNWHVPRAVKRAGAGSGRRPCAFQRDLWWLLRFRASLARRTRSESSDFALLSTARLLALRLRPARLMKNVSMRMPEPGPLGETLLDANVRAIVAASLLKSPAGGWVDSVLTFALHFLFVAMVWTSFPVRCVMKAWPTGPGLQQALIADDVALPG